MRRSFASLFAIVVLAWPLRSAAPEPTGAVSQIDIPPSTDVTLPAARPDRAMELAVNVVVSRQGVAVDGVRVVWLDPDPTFGEIPPDQLRGSLVRPLFDVLVEKADVERRIAEVSERHPFEGKLLLQVDEATPFSVMRTVLYTASQAGFVEPMFAVRDPAGGHGVVTLPPLDPGADRGDLIAVIVGKEPTPAPGPPPLNPVIRLRPDGFEITTSDPDAPCGGAPCVIPCRQEGCPSYAGWDVPGMQAQLRAIKHVRPDHEWAIIAPDRGTRHDLLIAALSATRRDAVGELFVRVAVVTGTP